MNFSEKVFEFILYFFRVESEGKDIIKFGFTHILILLISFLGAILIYYFRDKLKESNRLLKTFIICVAVQQSFLYGWYILGGDFSWEVSLPLYDCRVAILSLIYGVFWKNDKFKRIGIYLGLIGSIVALLSPELDGFMYPHFTWYSFFIGHIMLLWITCYIFFVEEITISKEGYREVFVFTNILHLTLILLNKLINSNYAYLSEPPIFKGVLNYLPGYYYSFAMLLLLNLGLYFVHSYFVSSREGKFKKLIIKKS